MSKEIKRTNIILLFILILTTAYAGGFFEYISCGLNVLFSVYMAYTVIITNKKNYKVDISFIVVLFVVLSYLFTCLWAIDRGFALLGFFKFLPLLFWIVYLRIYEDKEYFISKLPLIGSLLTIFTYTMSFFDVYKNKVEVAGRLGGSFQYPNTFAIFLLICLIVNFWDKDYFSIIYSVILIIGIYLSKSRTVLILAFISVILIAISNKKLRKYLIIVLPSVIAIISILIVSNKVNMSLSTFYGRFLYYKDALRIIFKHPFGLGYYGYFFIESSVQTGVYTVVNVHNEFLQIMLDVGIIPAILFYGVVFYTFFKKEQSIRNRIVLLVIILHSLFDFDFQFISILFILFLFIEPIYINEKERKISYGPVLKTIVVIVLIPLIIESVIMGTSVFLYNHGKYSKSYNFGKFNTMAEIRLMDIEEDIEEKEKIADDIIEKNKYIYDAYSIKAAAAYSKGNIEDFIKYKEKAIKLAPYNYDEYIDYLNKMIYVCESYIANKDMDSANICLKRIKKIPDMLSEVADNTDKLAWKINDLPKLSVSAEYFKIIDDLEGKIND